MKFFAFHLFIFTHALTVSAQHADKLMISDEGRIELYTEAGYISKISGDKFPFHKKFHIVITDQSSGKIREEFFHYSDSCFAYIQYDSSLQEKMKGLICLNNAKKHYDTLNMPDVEKDGNLGLLFKDTVFVSYYFERTGMWEEVESTLIIRRGTYKAGNKTGIWKVGHYEKNSQDAHLPRIYPDKIFIVECVEKYNDGNLDINYTPDFSLIAAWGKLKGGWIFSKFNSVYGYQHMYLKEEKSSLSKGSLSFTFEDSSFLSEDSDKKIRWKLDNGVFYKYYSKENVRKYRIDYLSENELYLTPLPADLNVKTKKKKK